jgi:hypothetical protein
MKRWVKLPKVKEKKYKKKRRKRIEKKSAPFSPIITEK